MADGTLNLKVYIGIGDGEPKEVAVIGVPLKIRIESGRGFVQADFTDVREVVKMTIEQIFKEETSND